MTLSLIVAVSKNGFIGKNGSLPWQISEDLKRFKKITSNSVVIMGKNTFLSIGKALPDRENVVVSTTLNSADGCEIIRSLEEAINSSKEKFPDKDIFLIGGYAIYKNGEIFADTLYLTKVDVKVEGDVSLPDFDWESWKEIEREDFFDEGSGINCALIKYAKNP
jgi:dihydrofolate reductase